MSLSFAGDESSWEEGSSRPNAASSSPSYDLGSAPYPSLGHGPSSDAYVLGHQRRVYSVTSHVVARLAFHGMDPTDSRTNPLKTGGDDTSSPRPSAKPTSVPSHTHVPAHHLALAGPCLALPCLALEHPCLASVRPSPSCPRAPILMI